MLQILFKTFKSTVARICNQSNIQNIDMLQPRVDKQVSKLQRLLQLNHNIIIYKREDRQKVSETASKNLRLKSLHCAIFKL